jgi:hypothetical protein
LHLSYWDRLCACFPYICLTVGILRGRNTGLDLIATVSTDGPLGDSPPILLSFRYDILAPTTHCSISTLHVGYDECMYDGFFA